MSTAAPELVTAFRTAISERLGLWFDDAKLSFLAEVLARRSEANGETPHGYLDRFTLTREGSDEVRRLAAELTVGETYFFRHFEQFRAFREVALPARIEARNVVRQLRVLSSGCATGEEAYSLSIILREANLPAGFQASVLGVDLNAASLERAERARYSPWALREAPEALKRQYFRQEGKDFQLLRERLLPVSFEQYNLAGSEERFPAECFDVVFCRNVLMYFSPAQTERVVQRLTRALAPGGFLFMGHAENLRGLSHDFHLQHTHGTFYYQRKGGLGRGVSTDGGEHELTPRAIGAPSPAPSPAWETAWLETVERANDRIRALSERDQRAEPTLNAVSGPRPKRAPDLRVARALLEDERFADALDSLARGSSDTDDADALLLKCALLTHSERLDEAEAACRELLALDELHAGAHYLLALCSERRGELKDAVEHDQIACYLDDTFSMPRLHQGLMARRAGNRELAKRELGQAFLLLQREDTARILLFGGGFKREALVGLCRSELERLGALT